MEAFDPYYKWLGIPPEEQPPTHYRLLGLRIFENDSDVIESAAEQRMLLLRSRQTGPHALICQRLLNEIAAATNCLLDDQLRSSYNAELRTRSAERTISPPPPVPDSAPAPAVAEASLPRATPPPLPRAEPVSPPRAEEPSLANEPPLAPSPAPAVLEAKPAPCDVSPSAPPVDSWHVQTPDGAYWGPVSLGEVEGWAADGRISAGSYLLPAGSDEWVAATRMITFPDAQTNAPAAQATPVEYGRPEAAGQRCPYCHSIDTPIAGTAISAVGWVVFGLLLILFCPLCFLGLLITEPRRMCRQCGRRLP